MWKLETKQFWQLNYIMNKDIISPSDAHSLHKLDFAKCSLLWFCIRFFFTTYEQQSSSTPISPQPALSHSVGRGSPFLLHELLFVSRYLWVFPLSSCLQLSSWWLALAVCMAAYAERVHIFIIVVFLLYLSVMANHFFSLDHLQSHGLTFL